MKNIFVSLAVILFFSVASFSQEKLEVDGNARISGKVGIGTPTAINKLDVRSSDSSSDIMQAQATWTAGANSNIAAIVGKNSIDAGFGFGVAGEGGQAGVLGNSANIGVQGNGNSIGVKGLGFYGVQGLSNSNGGVGVYAKSSFVGGVSNTSFIGEAYGSTGTGHNTGGRFTASGAGGAQNNGIIAEASGAPINYAGLFSGDVFISGTLSKGSGSFKIDHPLDPENKYLYHSFVESPDMMNVYNGNITTDASGLAEVELPTYFMSLNQDFRYQLTVIGTFAQAIVSEEVSDNHFVIKTNEPSVKVSWQVTGIRKDPYAVKNRIQEEVNKAPNERGLYLHPEAYGQPASKSVFGQMIDAVQLNRADKKVRTDID